jgi:hypothetical protein
MGIVVVVVGVSVFVHPRRSKEKARKPKANFFVNPLLFY